MTTDRGGIALGGLTGSWTLWDRGKCPLHGPSLAIDTETEPITIDYETPVPVIMQVSDGAAVHIIPAAEMAYYLQAALSMSPPARKLHFFNAAFDLRVIGCPFLYDEADRGNVIDLAESHCVAAIAEKGYYKQPVTLEAVVRERLAIRISKQQELRLSFRKDQALTEAQCQYAAIDAFVTWHLAQAIGPQPTDALQTRAAIVLDAIGRNGMPVDRARFDERRAQALAEKEQDGARLLELGFPLGRQSTVKDNLVDVDAALKKLLGTGLSQRPGLPALRMLVASAAAAMTGDGTARQSAIDGMRIMAADLSRMERDPKAARPKGQKDWKEAFEKVLDGLGMPDIAESRAPTQLMGLLLAMLQQLVAGAESKAAVKACGDEYIERKGWDIKAKRIGPQAYLQRHMEELEARYGIQFERTTGGKTKKAPMIRVSKLDKWSMAEHKIDDPLMTTYIRYKAAEKLLSTYFNPKHIKADGRMHPRFRNMVRTGRTAASKPNLQNPPKKANYRECFVAPPGHVFAAIDYGMIELCALAQHCWSTYKRSKMRELINSDVDLHAWFAGRTLGLVDASNDYDGTPESLERLRPVLDDIKANRKKNRDEAKEANFGYPGGMGAKRFYLGCRMKGLSGMTLERAEQLREGWIAAFPEMRLHFQPQECAGANPGGHQEGAKERYYQARTLTGRLRRFCSYCSSLNLVFQGPAADGGKVAMWRLWRAGFKIVNFVHDEFIFEMLEDGRLQARLKEAEELMVAGMRSILPDVLVKVETTVMRTWSKAAKHEITEDGDLIAWDIEDDEEEESNPNQEERCELPKSQKDSAALRPIIW